MMAVGMIVLRFRRARRASLRIVSPHWMTVSDAGYFWSPA